MKFSSAMSAIPYGLFLLAANDGRRDNACVINTVMQVTTSPNQVVFTVNRRNLTHDMVKEAGRFALSVLSEEAPLALYQRFGFQSGRDKDKFAGYADVARGEGGGLYLTRGANAWMEGQVETLTDLGSHSLFLAQITQSGLLSSAPSATYDYYQRQIKPKPAPSPKKRWVCKVCGYIYEGESLPADFICPWCKHPAEDFEPLAE